MNRTAVIFQINTAAALFLYQKVGSHGRDLAPIPAEIRFTEPGSVSAGAKFRLAKVDRKQPAANAAFLTVVHRVFDPSGGAGRHLETVPA